MAIAGPTGPTGGASRAAVPPVSTVPVVPALPSSLPAAKCSKPGGKPGKQSKLTAFPQALRGPVVAASVSGSVATNVVMSTCTDESSDAMAAPVLAPVSPVLSPVDAAPVSEVVSAPVAPVALESTPMADPKTASLVGDTLRLILGDEEVARSALCALQTGKVSRSRFGERDIDFETVLAMTMTKHTWNLICCLFDEDARTFLVTHVRDDTAQVKQVSSVAVDDRYVTTRGTRGNRVVEGGNEGVNNGGKSRDQADLAVSDVFHSTES